MLGGPLCSQSPVGTLARPQDKVEGLPRNAPAGRKRLRPTPGRSARLWRCQRCSTESPNAKMRDELSNRKLINVIAHRLDAAGMPL